MNIETGDLQPNHGATPTFAEPIAPAQPPTLHRIFIGKDGLRAGWSLLIFLALLAIILFCADRTLHKLHFAPPKSDTEISPSFGLSTEGLNFLAVLFLTWIMSKIERRPVSVYGFGDKCKLPHFFAGMAWGVACISLLILTLVKTGFLVIDSRALFGSDILRYGAIWFLGFLLVGLFEEYFSRGYVQYTLTRGLGGLYQWTFKTRYSKTLGFWTSAVVFSVLFGLGHGSNPGESPIGLLAAGLAGMVWCFSLWRTGSLWWAIGFHAAWDWGESFVYGVADSGLVVQHHLLATHPVGKPILSGGTTGPEGSIFILAILSLVTLIIHFTLPRSQDARTA